MRKSPFVRSPYNYDLDQASNEAAIPAGMQGDSLTVQSMTEDSDLNVLMKRYGITGKFPESPIVPSYGDFSEVTDFRSALEAVESGRSAFMQYPAEFRARFDNNPQLFLEFCSNEANRPHMEALGLLKPKIGGEVPPPPQTTPGGSSQAAAPPPEVKG